MLMRPALGEYVELVWDQDGAAPAHYVAGHVTPDEFRAELARRFDGSRRTPATTPEDSQIEHVYVRNVRVENDSWGNRRYEVRHCPADAHGAQPRTYWEIEPNRGPVSGGIDGLLTGIRVRCGCCDGTGMRPLTPVERETLDAVGDAPSLLADIAQRLPKRSRPAGTALANRLVHLEAIGLVIRERQPGPVLGRGHGKALLWRRVTT